MARKYNLDVDFFENIDSEEKAYILGLFIADGYMNQKTAFIALSKRDVDILEKTKSALKSEAPFSVKKKTGNQQDLLVLCICSKKLVGDLNLLGVKQNKTFSIEYPSIPESLDRHFIRGLYDGDGHIGEGQFVLTGGSSSLLKTVQQKIQKNTQQFLSISENNNNYRLCGYKKDHSVLKWLYEDNRISLNRKNESYNLHYKNK